MDETVQSVTVYEFAVRVDGWRGRGIAVRNAVIDAAGPSRVLAAPYLSAGICIKGDDMPGFGGDKDKVFLTVRRRDRTEVNRRSVGNAG